MKLSNNRYLAFGIFLLLSTGLYSCKKFVDIGSPDGQVPAAEVFKNDASATASVIALYNNGNWRDGLLNTTLYSGLAADELMTNLTGGVTEFQNNNISTGNLFSANGPWYFSYRELTNANIAIDGISKSQTLTPSVKDQLLGEAKFWRAYALANLVGIYGGVPMGLSAEPLDNAFLPRSTETEVWAQIIKDLTEAKAVLKPAYPSQDRARVNQYAVSALLARAYLYTKDWAKAEAEATSTISSGVYSLPAPSAVFVKTSNETILQIFTLNGFTSWGANYVPASASSGNPNYFLRTGFVNAFEAADLRRTNWVNAVSSDPASEFYINKYKLRTGTAGNEYYVVLRLAEQYLIRAEARAQQDKLTGAAGAEADLNAVRARAELGAKTNLNKAAMLLAIEQERKVELFGEYAHRWFDLKRTVSVTDAAKTRADDLLSVVKGANWQSTDVLFPIPADERAKNTALTQNPGYN